MKDEAYYRQRLGVHKRRMRYWANLPNFKGFGPTGKNLKRCHEFYEIACDDAVSIAFEITKITGKPCRVVDTLKTFQARFNNPKADIVYL